MPKGPFATAHRPFFARSLMLNLQHASLQTLVAYKERNTLAPVFAAQVDERIALIRENIEGLSLFMAVKRMVVA
jgi:hypothetical protein